MQPNIWGKYVWLSLHFIALGYPLNPSATNKAQYYAFFHNLQKVLPCETCSIHYKELLEKKPLTDDILSSREKLFRWTVEIHNSVNVDIGKNVMKYEDAKLFFTKFLVDNNDKITNMFQKLGNMKNTYDTTKIDLSLLHFIVFLGLLILILLLVYTFLKK